MLDSSTLKAAELLLTCRNPCITDSWRDGALLTHPGRGEGFGLAYPQKPVMASPLTHSPWELPSKTWTSRLDEAWSNPV